MFIRSIYGVITLENNTYYFIEEIFKSVKNRYGNLDKIKEAGGFSFDHVSKLTVKCTTVNEPKLASYTESPDCLKCKSTTINPKQIDDRCFRYDFALTQQHEEIKNHPEQISNIKSFIDLYNWDGMKHPTIINNNNYYTLLEKRSRNCFSCAIC